MNDETKQKLERLANKKMDCVLFGDEADADASKETFQDGMDAIDRLAVLEKQEAEKDLKEKELLETKKATRVNWVLKVLEIAAIPIGLAILNIKANDRQLDKINKFESDGKIYTSTSGRSTGKIIKWK